ncbi:MAG: hypothetical protein ACFFAI_13150 [Promethearchaeota archaeon]
MIDQTSIRKNEVVIIKGNTSKKSVLKGIKIVGGISKFIEEGNQVFIKFNLNLPFRFSTNTNFEVLKLLIELYNKIGTRKVYLGSFPSEGSSIDTLVKLKRLFQ